MFFSEIYAIEDAIFYDNATSNKVSNYNTVNNTLTYDTDHYQSVSSSSTSLSNYFAFTNPKADLRLPRNVEVEIDIMQTQTLNCQWGISFTNGQGKTSSTYYATCGSFDSNTTGKGIICNAPWGSLRTQGQLSLNTWYHFKVTVTGTVVSFKITDSNDNVLFNDNLTISFMSSLTYLNVHQGQASNTVQFKNLKIKAL
ncbi:MAG: hypothetical protein IKF79_02280 [Methanosphaera sp.]|nr:hypothetical protein [Methanosphaera sp.]